ncbi:hypothetical protein BX600DRAFT_428721 [Xylariales sp. PMI_506]|nr:hypothetical protein BX600DRAFT_428721 [Xylariales sp. PMI_506]
MFISTETPSAGLEQSSFEIGPSPPEHVLINYSTGLPYYGKLRGTTDPRFTTKGFDEDAFPTSVAKSMDSVNFTNPLTPLNNDFNEDGGEDTTTLPPLLLDLERITRDSHIHCTSIGFFIVKDTREEDAPPLTTMTLFISVLPDAITWTQGMRLAQDCHCAMSKYGIDLNTVQTDVVESID